MPKITVEKIKLTDKLLEAPVPLETKRSQPVNHDDSILSVPNYRRTRRHNEVEVVEEVEMTEEDLKWIQNLRQDYGQTSGEVVLETPEKKV